MLRSGARFRKQLGTIVTSAITAIIVLLLSEVVKRIINFYYPDVQNIAIVNPGVLALSASTQNSELKNQTSILTMSQIGDSDRKAVQKPSKPVHPLRLVWLQPAGYRAEQHSGLFNLERTPPTYYYTISLNNLGPYKVDFAEVWIEYKLPNRFLAIWPADKGKLYASNATDKPSSEPLTSNKNKIQGTLKDLKYDEPQYLNLAICSDEAPSFSDIQINVVCPDGKFEQTNFSQLQDLQRAYREYHAAMTEWEAKTKLK